MSEILDKACAMEAEGKAYYENLASQAHIPEIAGIFRHLAVEEQRHLALFSEWREGRAAGKKAASESAAVVAKNSFKKMASTFKSAESLKDAEEAYQKALELEKNSIAFYKNELSGAVDKEQEIFIQAVINEELSHAKIVENLIEFVRRPQNWLENAEWTHNEEY